MQNIQDTVTPDIQDTTAQDTPAARFDRLIEGINRSSLYIATLAAWIATVGSLFLSEVLLWVPCVLCWYQRILMYPLALILPIGILRRDRGLPWYVLPLSLFGAGIALYHYLLIKTNLFPPPPCAGTIPCTVEYMNFLGFINVPFLALTAFLIISVMVIGSALGADDADEPVLFGQRVVSFLILLAIIAVVIGGFIFFRNMVLSG